MHSFLSISVIKLHCIRAPSFGSCILPRDAGVDAFYFVGRFLMAPASRGRKKKAFQMLRRAAPWHRSASEKKTHRLGWDSWSSSLAAHLT